MTFTEAVQLAEAMSKKVWEVSEILVDHGVNPDEAAKKAEALVSRYTKLVDEERELRATKSIPALRKDGEPYIYKDGSPVINYNPYARRALGYVRKEDGTIVKQFEVKNPHACPTTRKGKECRHVLRLSKAQRKKSPAFHGAFEALRDLGLADRGMTDDLLGVLGIKTMSVEQAAEKLGGEVHRDDDPADWWKKQ